jgi:hypothetical protein
MASLLSISLSSSILSFSDDHGMPFSTPRVCSYHSQNLVSCLHPRASLVHSDTHLVEITPERSIHLHARSATEVKLSHHGSVWSPLCASELVSGAGHRSQAQPNTYHMQTPWPVVFLPYLPLLPCFSSFEYFAGKHLLTIVLVSVNSSFRLWWFFSCVEGSVREPAQGVHFWPYDN